MTFDPDDPQVNRPPTDTDDLEARERDLREASGFDPPRDAVRASRSTATPPRSCAVLRRPAPTHNRTPPHGVTVTGAFAECPLPRGSVVVGPVTSRDQAREYLDDGAGWLLCVNPDGTREPVPVVTGHYYDGTPQLAIIAECLVPPPETDLADALEVTT